MKTIKTSQWETMARNDKVPGGKGDEAKEADVDPDQLSKGTEIELEHTNDRALAKEIAIDHLMEFPDYYDRLEKMEQDAK
jgi:hypothetical protein